MDELDKAEYIDGVIKNAILQSKSFEDKPFDDILDTFDESIDDIAFPEDLSIKDLTERVTHTMACLISILEKLICRT